MQLLTSSGTIYTVGKGSEEYKSLAKLVSESYLSIHKAHIEPTPDEFVAMQVSNFSKEDFAGAYGVTYPKFGSLFSEKYIDHSIEMIASEFAGTEIVRSQICEIGSFSSFGYKTAAYKLLETLPQILWSKGMRFTLVTLTPIVENIINKLGYTYHPIGVADINKLPIEQRHQWGSYYDHRPIVFLVDILASAQSTLPLQFGRFNIDVIKINEPISQKLLSAA